MADEKQTQADIYKDPRAQMKSGNEKESYLFDNLEKGEVKTHPIVLAISVVFLVTGLVLPGYYGHKLSEEAIESGTVIQQLESDISLLDQQIATENGRGEALKKDMEDKIDTLISPLYRIKWSEVIKELEDVITRAADGSNSERLYTFNSFSVDNSGSVTVTGLTNSYPNIAVIIEEIEASDMFEGVEFSGASKSQNNDGSYAVPLDLKFSLIKQETSEEIFKTTK